MGNGTAMGDCDGGQRQEHEYSAGCVWRSQGGWSQPSAPGSWEHFTRGVDILSRRSYNILEFAKQPRLGVLGWGGGESGDVAQLVE